jgi:hypothetical protein
MRGVWVQGKEYGERVWDEASTTGVCVIALS